jgi:hypothetical protein
MSNLLITLSPFCLFGGTSPSPPRPADDISIPRDLPN